MAICAEAVAISSNVAMKSVDADFDVPVIKNISWRGMVALRW
jgi:hypothetical protein